MSFGRRWVGHRWLLAREVTVENAKPSRIGLSWRLLRWLVLLGLALTGLAMWKSLPASGSPGRSHEGSSKRAVVPIQAAQAEVRKFPIYLNGLGIVQPFYGITMRARVDGELQQVYFQEGQSVEKGDLIAQIDPRAYQSPARSSEGQESPG